MNPGPLTPALASLAALWRAEATEARERYAAEGAARSLERCALALESALDAQAGELLPLERAADLSGYNADSLRRMAREGKLPTERRGRRLYFRAGDLPRKPPEVDGPRLVGYDPVADARMVAGKRQHGG